MATWTSQEGHAPPRCYFSAAPWSNQLVIERDLAPERVPWMFRGCTVSDQLTRFPDGVAAPDPGADYCGACGLLVVAKDHHEASARHLAATKTKVRPSSRSAARVDLAAVRAQMRADPASAATILASAAAEVSQPANVASAAPPVELRGLGGSGFSSGSALRAEALPGAGGAAHAPAAEAAEFLGPAGGGLASVLEPRPADPAAATPMEQGLEDQGPTRDLLKLLDEFSRR